MWKYLISVKAHCLVGVQMCLLVPARGQVSVLKTTQGYAHVIRKGGSDPFFAYAVINDGAEAGQRSGDDAFVPSLP